MYRAFLPLSLLMVLYCPLSASAGGMAVADAISHMYESQEITKLVEQIELATNQLELVQQYTDTFQNAYDKAHANYAKAKQVYDNIMAVKDFYDESKASLMGRYNEIMGLYETLSDADLEDLADLLDVTFIDPRNMSVEDWAKIMDRQYDTRQMGLKDVMDSNEETLKSMEDKVGHMQDMADQADETESPKEAQDMTNALLLEILQVLHEMLAMDAKYQQAMASQKYKGVTKESIAARQKTLKAIDEWAKKERWERKELAKYNLDKDSNIMDIVNNEKKPSLDEIINWE